MSGCPASPSCSLVPLAVQTGAKARRLSLTALEFSAETDSPLEEDRFELPVPPMSFLSSATQFRLRECGSDAAKARYPVKFARLAAGGRRIRTSSTAARKAVDSAAFRAIAGVSAGL